jgi:4-hydroxybutyrate CoA-transferase
MVNGQRMSRIVPALPEGGVVTVPRTLVDYVVTEHGIAHLRGKTIRQRVGELINIAHPDFREELMTQALRLYSTSG